MSHIDNVREKERCSSDKEVEDEVERGRGRERKRQRELWHSCWLLPTREGGRGHRGEGQPSLRAPHQTSMAVIHLVAILAQAVLILLILSS